MTAFRALPPSARPDRGTVDRVLLAEIRLAARDCRAGARIDATCACLSPGDGADRSLCLLVATVSRASGRRLTIYRPGEPEVGFDESWLLATVAAAGRGDAHSLRFLTVSRLDPAFRARVAALAHDAARPRGHDAEGMADGRKTSATAALQWSPPAPISLEEGGREAGDPAPPLPRPVHPFSGDARWRNPQPISARPPARRLPKP